eukprot:scaffold1738_cov73-Phaeocystis_antarctica.AAC.9
MYHVIHRDSTVNGPPPPPQTCRLRHGGAGGGRAARCGVAQLTHTHRASTLTAGPLIACRPVNRGHASGTRSLGCRVSDRSRSLPVR